MTDKKLPYVLGPTKNGYYRFQANMSYEAAKELSKALVRIRKHFPDGTMSAAWCKATQLLDNVLKAQAKIDHALEIIAAQAKISGSRESLPPVVINTTKALTGCPTDTRVEFVGESGEYRKFWEQADDEQNR